MKTVVAILSLAFVAIGPASAESAKHFAPGQHLKGTHNQPGASYYAPGHQKRLPLYNQQNARLRSPGHLK
jgi:hypothetical protein